MNLRDLKELLAGVGEEYDTLAVRLMTPPSSRYDDPIEFAKLEGEVVVHGGDYVQLTVSKVVVKRS